MYRLTGCMWGTHEFVSKFHIPLNDLHIYHHGTWRMFHNGGLGYSHVASCWLLLLCHRTLVIPAAMFFSFISVCL